MLQRLRVLRVAWALPQQCWAATELAGASRADLCKILLPPGLSLWRHGYSTSAPQGSFAATQALLESAQAHLFHPRLEELRQQHACLPFTDLVDECRKSMAPGAEEDAQRVCEALASAGLILRQGQLALLRPGDISDVVLQVLPVDRAALQQRLEAAQAALAPMEEERSRLERRVALRRTAFKWGGLSVLVGHFGIFTRLTYWELSWDVMEPIAFLVSSFSSVLTYAWFMRTEAEFTWSDAQQRVVTRAEERAFRKANFPWDRYCQLRREVARYGDMLAAQQQLEDTRAAEAEAAAGAEEQGEGGGAEKAG